MPFLSPRTFTLFALISLLALQTGCAGHPAAQKSVLWQSRDQFVALVDRDDKGAERQTPNQHPVTLAPARVRAELAGLQLKSPGEAKGKPLFGDEDLKVLQEQLPEALQKARPDQDVVFAVYGRDPILKGFGHEEVVTTGRAFYRDNSLNLLLGMVREKIREYDRRLQPFTPASRARGAQIPGELSSASPKATFAAGRGDWLVIPIPAGAAEEAQPEPQAQAPSAKEAPAAAKTVAPAARSIEERLRILGELKAKGLITEEEYRAKKESILKEL